MGGSFEGFGRRHGALDDEGHARLIAKGAVGQRHHIAELLFRAQFGEVRLTHQLCR